MGAIRFEWTKKSLMLRLSCWIRQGVAWRDNPALLRVASDVNCPGWWRQSSFGGWLPRVNCLTWLQPALGKRVASDVNSHEDVHCDWKKKLVMLNSGEQKRKTCKQDHLLDLHVVWLCVIHERENKIKVSISWRGERGNPRFVIELLFPCVFRCGCRSWYQLWKEFLSYQV